jgi:hypothetical protein
MALTDKIADCWNNMSPQTKIKIATGALLVGSLASLVGCSSKPAINYSDIAAKENKIIERIQQLPMNPIDGVTYDMQDNGLKRPQTVGVTKFSFEGANYSIGTPAYDNTDRTFRFYLVFHMEDKEKSISFVECGTDRLQPNLGSIDGDIDGGEITPKIKGGYSGAYNRFYQESDVKGELEKYEIPIIENTLKILKIN